MNIRFTTFSFLLSFFLGFHISFAQDSNLEAAKYHLKINQKKFQLSDNDLAEMQLSSAYISPSTGWYHAYFAQNFQSIEVYNGIFSVALNNGHLIHTGNNFIVNVEEQLNTVSKKPQITALSALT
ncbi:MAG: hypothetical protein MUF45_02440, partial [Spirosomaceae bacterium]|nr:hypothetical protein [Spirosomataceae bacterium]